MDSNGQIYRCGVRFVILSLILIAATTLFPYDFSVAWQIKESASTDYFLAHLLLFVPLGFGLACVTQKRREGKLRGLFIVLTASVCVSAAAEILQVFLPTRSTSLSDAVANILGAFVGVLMFNALRPQIASHIWTFRRVAERFLRMRVVAPSCLGYLAVTCFVTVILQRTTSLTSWDDSFPLLVGNELTENRAWNGRIYQLQIASRAISEEELTRVVERNGRFPLIEGPLVASYLFTDERVFRDRSGHLSGLVWRGRCTARLEGKGAFVGAGCWLQTDGAATTLTRALARTSQFTLAATVAAANPVQTGPARILSLSKDPFHRNFTLGQEGNDLVFRLRTSLTGVNGMNPQLVVPGVFVNDEPISLLALYDGSIVSVFVNGIQRGSLELLPEASLFSYWSAITPDNITGYRVLYYGLVFIPFGFFLAFFNNALNYRPGVRRAVAAAGIILPAAVLESVLMGITKMRVGHLLLGTIFTAAAMLLFSPLESV